MLQCGKLIIVSFLDSNGIAFFGFSMNEFRSRFCFSAFSQTGDEKMTFYVVFLMYEIQAFIYV